eukprot:gene4839-6872_t
MTIARTIHSLQLQQLQPKLKMTTTTKDNSAAAVRGGCSG